MTMLAAVSLTLSCAKTEYVQVDQEIILSAFGDSVTKSDPLPMGLDKVFGVYAYYAYCQGNIAWNTPQAWGNASEYFSNAAFEYQGENWGGSDMSYYWPISGALMFAGYCPHQEYSDGTITAVTIVPNKTDLNPYLQINFKQNLTLSDMVDLLWFDVKDVAAGKTLSKTGNAVPVTFKHALSKVSFTFADTKDIYKLKSVLLRGVVNEGTFYSGNTAGWLPELAENTLADYVLLTEKQTYPDLNEWNSGNLYVIPQYLDGIFPTILGTLDSGVDVVLEFTLTDGFGTQTIEIPLKDYTEKWDNGKSYHYTIRANADPIEFGAPTFSITAQTVAM